MSKRLAQEIVSRARKCCDKYFECIASRALKFIDKREWYEGIDDDSVGQQVYAISRGWAS